MNLGQLDIITVILGSMPDTNNVSSLTKVNQDYQDGPFVLADMAIVPVRVAELFELNN